MDVDSIKLKNSVNCSDVGCAKPAKKRGLCQLHYGQWYRCQVVSSEVRKCSIDGCDRPFAAKNLCQWHHRRMIKSGDPLAGGFSYDSPKKAIEERTVRSLNGCLEWTGAACHIGYGRMKVSGVKKLAHRVSYEIHVGPIPDGLFVLHRCDNPRCVDPAHLFLGTNQDNMDDMNAKNRGRKARGSASGCAKLKESDVLKIRNDIRNIRDIAASYGVGKSTIGYIKSRVTWRHV